MIARLESGAGAYAAAQDRETGGGIAVNPEPVNMYRAEVEAFSKAILEGAPPPVSGRDGRWSQAVLAACYESAAKGCRVTLPAFD